MTDDEGPAGRRRGPPPTLKGYELDEVVSALQKAIRRGDEEGAVYWVIELDRSGFVAYAFRRLAVIASEDVGLADPMAVLLVEAMRSNWQFARDHDKRARGGLFLVHAVVALVRARKSRLVDHAAIAISADETVRPIPELALDVHTRRGRAAGRTREHFFEEGSLLANVETGELEHEPHLEDPYRERARAAGQRRRKPEPQLTIEEDQQ